jgi:gas vesicle protein
MSDGNGNDAATYLGWFFLGALAGAAAALLLAPKSGRETRELLTEQSGELMKKGKERGGEWLKKAQEKAGDAQVKAGDLFDKGREYFEEQTQRLVSAFEAGKSAMREEMKERPEG